LLQLFLHDASASSDLGNRRSTMMDASAYLQTPHGKGGIAVVVIQGQGARLALSRIFRPLASHEAGGDGLLQLGHIVDGPTVVDEAIVRAGAGSVDGQALRASGGICAVGAARECENVEINIHGGPIAAQAVMELLKAIGVQTVGAPACEAQVPKGRRPGATFNPSHPQWNNPAVGVELLNCLASARSQFVMLALARQWSGGISRLARQTMDWLDGREKWGASPSVPKLARQALAAIDRGQAAALPFAAALREAAGSYAAMRRLLEPPRVVLAGAPNAGKSTLANALVGRPVSIVHETPGTTRDWVSELALIGGVPIMLTDTAGIWEEDAGTPRRQDAKTKSERSEHLAEAVDLEAVERARQQIGQADVVLLLVNEDGGSPVNSQPAGSVGQRDAGGLVPSGAKIIRVWAKADLAGLRHAVAATAAQAGPRDNFDVAVSAINGEGLEQLGQRILHALGLAGFDPCDPHAFTARQADLLVAAAEAVENGGLDAGRDRLAELLLGGVDEPGA
jgi:tRNA modification GTPase